MKGLKPLLLYRVFGVYKRTEQSYVKDFKMEGEKLRKQLEQDSFLDTAYDVGAESASDAVTLVTKSYNDDGYHFKLVSVNPLEVAVAKYPTRIQIREEAVPVQAGNAGA